LISKNCNENDTHNAGSADPLMLLAINAVRMIYKLQTVSLLNWHSHVVGELCAVGMINKMQKVDLLTRHSHVIKEL
jgi:hypothetical protein